MLLESNWILGELYGSMTVGTSGSGLICTRAAVHVDGLECLFLWLVIAIDKFWKNECLCTLHK